MQNWDDIVNSGIVPKEYVQETTPGQKTGRSINFFAAMRPTTADAAGQQINSAIRQARGRGRNGLEEDTPEYMRREWGWSDEELNKSASFFHAAPKHARPHIEVNGLRPNLTSTVGDPHELKQRYGIFGNKHAPEVSYGLDAAHPDEDGVKRADIYHVKLPSTDVRIDPYGYPYSERTVKTHEFERIGHAIQRPNERPETHEGIEENCSVCQAH